MDLRTRHQGGWSASFIIIGIVLVLGLLGSVYYLKTHADRLAKAPADTSKTTQTNKTDTSSSSTDQSTDTKQTDTSAKDDKQTASEPSASSSEPAKSPATPDTSAPTDTSSSAALPHTGPADTVAHVVAASVLMFASVTFVRSRRM